MIRRSFLLSTLAPAAARLARGASALESKRGVHPRLFLDTAGFSRLRSSIRTTHAALWDLTRQQADRIAAEKPPRYEDQYREGDSEQLWQRPVGSKMPYLAMAYRLTGEPRYLQAARDWALASCGYQHWGLGIQDGCALSAGHQLVGMATLYDWLYQDLDAPTRETIRRTLLRRCRDCFVGIPRRRKPLLQNHLWIPATGLVAAGLAIFDEEEAAAEFPRWMDLVIGKYRGTEAALGSDGASHEGIGYWSYGVEYMLKYWHLASDFLGENPTSPWWRNTAAYRLYLGLPRNAWTRQNNIVDIADCPRSGWYGPDYLLRRLAHLYQDPHAQWLAQEVNAAGIYSTEALWLNLIWNDPSVPARPPSDLPTLRHFEDMEIVSARSGWSGDESLAVFKCGPPAGHEAKPRFDDNPGIGHVHPDAGHFVLFGAGEWLIRDDGYLAKMTDQHNTLLVDGRGQLGEGGEWLNPKDWYPGPKSEPRVLRAVSTLEVDEIIGDAAPAYPESLGLRQFTRRLHYLKPDALIVVDEIEVEEPRPLELRFHPEFPAVKQEDGSFLCRGQKAVLRVEPLTPEEVQATAEETPITGRGRRPASMHAIRLTSRKARWRNAVAFSWAPLGRQPARVALERYRDGGAGSSNAHDSGNALWVFRAGDRRVYLNWDLRAGS